MLYPYDIHTGLIVHSCYITQSTFDRHLIATWLKLARYLIDTWLPLDRHLIDTWSILDQHFIDVVYIWPTLDRQNLYLIDTWSTLNRHLVSLTSDSLSSGEVQFSILRLEYYTYTTIVQRSYFIYNIFIHTRFVLWSYNIRTRSKIRSVQHSY